MTLIIIRWLRLLFMVINCPGATFNQSFASIYPPLDDYKFPRRTLHLADFVYVLCFVNACKLQSVIFPLFNTFLFATCLYSSLIIYSCLIVFFYHIFLLLTANTTKMFKIYHDWRLVNNNGARKSIEFRRGEKCLWATSEPFWKRSQGCTNNGVKTRCMEDRLK